MSQPPTGVLRITPFDLGVLVRWTARDPEGDAFRCTLDFGDGRKETFSTCPPTGVLNYRYANEGTYTVRLILSDVSGSTRALEKTVVLPATAAGACPTPIGTDSLPGPKAAPSGVRFARGAAFEPGKLLVRLPAMRLQSLKADAGRLGILSITPAGPGWAVLEVPAGSERERAEALYAEGLVEYAQPVYRYRLVGVPNDPYFAGNQADQFAQMALTEGWDLLDSGACRPIVAVLDTGADLDHPDLSANLLPGYDFSDGDDDPSDEEGHGTMVAGIIGAVTNNGIGVAGSTNNLAYVLPVKVFPNANSVTIAEAIRWAADAGAHLINLSLCLLSEHDYNGDDLNDCAAPDDPGIPDAAIEDALEYAYNHGVLAVAASGNDGLDYVGYPASSVYTFAVGSVDASDNRSSFSNYGDDLDFVAPGESVTSTVPDDYGTGSGTSFATPYVTGELALYLGQYYAKKGALPSFSQAATCFANNTNQASWRSETGYGVPQANAFLDPADGSCYPPSP